LAIHTDDLDRRLHIASLDVPKRPSASAFLFEAHSLLHVGHVVMDLGVRVLVPVRVRVVRIPVHPGIDSPRDNPVTEPEILLQLIEIADNELDRDSSDIGLFDHLLNSQLEMLRVDIRLDIRQERVIPEVLTRLVNRTLDRALKLPRHVHRVDLLLKHPLCSVDVKRLERQVHLAEVGSIQRLEHLLVILMRLSGVMSTLSDLLRFLLAEVSNLLRVRLENRIEDQTLVVVDKLLVHVPKNLLSSAHYIGTGIKHPAAEVTHQRTARVRGIALTRERTLLSSREREQVTNSTHNSLGRAHCDIDHRSNAVDEPLDQSLSRANQQTTQVA